MNNVKIGDFGLATSGQVATEMAQITVDPVELTRSIGTAVYTAPEARSKGKGTYTTKVDVSVPFLCNCLSRRFIMSLTFS